MSAKELKPGSGKKVPITVTINPDRTIAAMRMAFPDSGWEVRFLDHRKAPAVVEPPASDVRELSGAMKEFYRNGVPKD
jgi:hypothetical protein